MASSVKLGPSDYGGVDTQDTHGIQPYPHTPTADEQLRLFYAEAMKED